MVDGVLIPVSSCSCITVDFWGKANRNVLAAFLTHAHADHVKGLGNTWNGHIPIYCSYASSRILLERFPGLKPALRVLEEKSTTLLRLASPLGVVNVHVTAYNANHCLGSLMLLLEGPFGRVLHTGDFRWEAEFAESMLIDEMLTWAPIDQLYIDNTYAHPRYDFPSRVDACQAVLDVVFAHPDKAILIGIDKLGKGELLVATGAGVVSGCVANKQWALLKVLGCYFGDADRLSPAVHAEELLAAIAAATGERVCVPAERWPLLEMLSLPTDRLFTTDTRATRIHAVLRHLITLRHVALINRKQPTIAILPSGFCFYNGSSKARQSIPTDVGRNAHAGSVSPAELEHASHCTFQVPYSLHCNYSELRNLIAVLRPLQVIPTVTHGVEADVSVGLDQLLSDLTQNSASGTMFWDSEMAPPALLQRKPAPLAAVSVQADCREPRPRDSATEQGLSATEWQGGHMDARFTSREGGSSAERCCSDLRQGHSSWQALWRQISEQLHMGRTNSSGRHSSTIQQAQDEGL